MDMRRYLDLFIDEAREHLRAANDLASRLASSPGDRSAHRELMRHVHSLKGMAGAMRYPSMTALAHALEDLLEHLLHAPEAEVQRFLPPLGESLESLSAVVERVRLDEDPTSKDAEALAARLRSTWASNSPGAAQARDTPSPSDPVAGPPAERHAPTLCPWRITLHLSGAARDSASGTVALVARLGRLGRVLRAGPPLLAVETGRFSGRLGLVLETATPRVELESALRGLGGVASFEIEPESPLAERDPPPVDSPEWVRVRADRLDLLLERVLELKLQQGRARACLPQGAARDQLERSDALLREVHAALMDLRLVPFESVAHRLRQHVEDLASDLDKQVTFVILGGQVRLDRRLLDALLDPLLHMVRNALDHGFEPAGERGERGKPRRGTLRLSLERAGDRIRIALEDDGRGIDPDEIKRVAVARGLVAEDEALALDEEQTLMLATLPGCSTARQVSVISGRGVGLDVARSSLERLGGQLAIASTRGTGTRMQLSVPLSLALIQVLLVRVDGQLYALPVDTVQRATLLETAALAASGVELVTLGERPELEPGRPDERRAVLLAGTEHPLALVVDQVLGRQEVVVKPFPPPLTPLPLFSGAALTENGSVALILDPQHLRHREADLPRSGGRA